MKHSASYRVLEHLTFQPTLNLLPPSTQATFLSAIPKVLGRWLASLSESWNDEAYLELTRRVVRETTEAVGAYATSDDCEVQERAANLVNLLSFVQADITAHQPAPAPPAPKVALDPDLDSDAHGFAQPDEDETVVTAVVTFPKSLVLLQPLFGAPLGVAPSRSLPVPSGLDLDAWIVPPPAKRVEETNGAAKPKSKKGKERATAADSAETGEVRIKKKKKRVDNGVHDTAAAASSSAAVPVETAEEHAERERVRPKRCLLAYTNGFRVEESRTLGANAGRPVLPLRSQSECSNTTSRAGRCGLHSHRSTGAAGTCSAAGSCAKLLGSAHPRVKHPCRQSRVRGQHAGHATASSDCARRRGRAVFSTGPNQSCPGQEEKDHGLFEEESGRCGRGVMMDIHG